jgi:hypothetical protein
MGFEELWKRVGVMTGDRTYMRLGVNRWLHMTFMSQVNDFTVRSHLWANRDIGLVYPLFSEN